MKNRDFSAIQYSLQPSKKPLGSIELIARESLNLFQRMEKAVAVWQDMPDKEPDGETICSLIEGLSEEEPHVEAS